MGGHCSKATAVAEPTTKPSTLLSSQSQNDAKSLGRSDVVVHTPTKERPEETMDLVCSVPELLIKEFDANGDSTAVVDGGSGEKTSYKELKQKILQCAAGWQAKGVQKGDVIALYAPNLPEWIVCFQGALLCGAVCTTFNPVYTPTEIEHCLSLSEASYMVTIPDLMPAAKQASDKVCAGQIKEFIVFGQCDGATPFSALLQENRAPLPVEIDPVTDLAVLPYSSGTTGLPKAVKLTHYNVTSNMIQCGAAAGIGKDDVVCAILPFFHIYGMTVLMNCGLRVGATVVTMPKFDPAEYLKNLKVHGVTIAHVAPPVVNFLAKHPAVDSVLPLPNLKELFCGAAPLGQELADAAKKRLGIASVRQGYGMTEMAPASHIGVFGTSKCGSIGRLVPNMLCKIIDPETGSSKGVGEAEFGEMWLKGPNIMQGYLKNDQATAETIVEDGWLRTGDIAYVDADGDYWIVDRLKELIKVKGFQVAPAELEDLLLQHPEIMDAAVIGVAAPREGDGQVPKAFVVKQEGSDLTEEAIKEWAKGKVTAYKAIAHVELIDKIPKSASGKILRKDLRAREGKTFA